MYAYNSPCYMCVWLVVPSSLAKRGRTNLVVQTSIGPIAKDFEIHMFSTN